MRRVRAVALAAVVSMAGVGLAALPAQAQPVVVGADALSEVRPEGARVVAVDPVEMDSAWTRRGHA